MFLRNSLEFTHYGWLFFGGGMSQTSLNKPSITGGIDKLTVHFLRVTHFCSRQIFYASFRVLNGMFLAFASEFTRFFEAQVEQTCRTWKVLNLGKVILNIFLEWKQKFIQGGRVWTSSVFSNTAFLGRLSEMPSRGLRYFPNNAASQVTVLTKVGWGFPFYLSGPMQQPTKLLLIY